MKKINKIAAIVCAGAMAVSAFAFAAGCSKDEDKTEDVSTDKIAGVIAEFGGKIMNAENVTVESTQKQTVKTTDDTTDKKAISYERTDAINLKALDDNGDRRGDETDEYSEKTQNAFNTEKPTEEEKSKTELYLRGPAVYGFKDGTLQNIYAEAPDTDRENSYFSYALMEISEPPLEYIPEMMMEYVKDNSETVYSKVSLRMDYNNYLCEITEGSYSAKRSDSKLEITISYKATHTAEKVPSYYESMDPEFVYSNLNYRTFEVSGEASYKVNLDAGIKAKDFSDPVTTENVAKVRYLDPTADYSSVASAIKNGEAFSIDLKGSGAATYTVNEESMPAVDSDDITVYFDYNDAAVKDVMAKAAASSYSDEKYLQGEIEVEVDGSTIKVAAGWKTEFMDNLKGYMEYMFGEDGYSPIEGFTFDESKVVLKYVKLSVSHRRANPDYDPTSEDWEVSPSLSCSSTTYINL